MEGAVLIGVAVAAWISYLAIRYLLKERYFAGEVFLAHRKRNAAVVAEHNELGQYIAEIRSRGLFAIGSSGSGAQAHLASFDNTSQWNYRRDRNLATYHKPNVHNCSLQVARNASADPLKYLVKYFNIRSGEATLHEVEALSDSIGRLEQAVTNLHAREKTITQSVSPPAFIMRHYLQEFMLKVGVELSPITVPYPQYVFEYVSAGGNSSQRTPITLTTPVIDALIETLGQKIKWRKSAIGQRALMTATLRNWIKTRDGHTCQTCSLSLAAEPNLLLEVDHIIPVSKGGLSHPDNLQTLCWRCNRSKSNKMPTDSHAEANVPPASDPQVRPAAWTATSDEVDPRREQLSQLFRTGVLTTEEFEAALARLKSQPEPIPARVKSAQKHLSKMPTHPQEKGKTLGITGLRLPHDESLSATAVTVNERNAMSYYPYVQGGPVEAGHLTIGGVDVAVYVNSRYAQMDESMVNQRATALFELAGVGMFTGAFRGDALMVLAAGTNEYERSLPPEFIAALLATYPTN